MALEDDGSGEDGGDGDDDVATKEDVQEGTNDNKNVVESTTKTDRDDEKIVSDLALSLGLAQKGGERSLEAGEERVNFRSGVGRDSTAKGSVDSATNGRENRLKSREDGVKVGTDTALGDSGVGESNRGTAEGSGECATQFHEKAVEGLTKAGVRGHIGLGSASENGLLNWLSVTIQLTYVGGMWTYKSRAESDEDFVKALAKGNSSGRGGGGRNSLGLKRPVS